MDISHPTVQAVPLARDRSSRKPAPLPGLPPFHIICKSPCIPQTCFVPLCRQGNLDPNLSPLRLPGTPRPPSTRDHPWLGLTSFVHSSSPALHNPSRLPTEPGVSSTPPSEPYNLPEELVRAASPLDREARPSASVREAMPSIRLDCTKCTVSSRLLAVNMCDKNNNQIVCFFKARCAAS